MSAILQSDTVSGAHFTHLAASPSAAQIMGQHFMMDQKAASTLGKGMRSAPNYQDEMPSSAPNPAPSVLSRAAQFGGNPNGS